LYQNKASSLKVYQQAESAWKGNLAKREALLQRLGSVGISKEQVKRGIQRLIWVKSTSAGVVESVLVHEGQTVTDNANLVEVLSDAGAQWVLSGFEAQTSLVQVGMKVEMGPAEGGTSQAINGRVAAVSPSIQSDRTWKIYCVLKGVRMGKDMVCVWDKPSKAKFQYNRAMRSYCRNLRFFSAMANIFVSLS
jgi:multidrug resistance efflux pump